MRVKPINPTLESLNHWITELPLKIYAWSDSALNNLQRFVRAQYEDQPYTVTIWSTISRKRIFHTFRNFYDNRGDLTNTER